MDETEKRAQEANTWPGRMVISSAFSAVTVILLLLKWFDIRYLSYFTDLSACSVYDVVARWADITDVLPLDHYTALVYVMGGLTVICALVHLFVFYQALQRKPDTASNGCAAAWSSVIVSIYTLIVIWALNGDETIIIFTLPFYLFAATGVLELVYYISEAKKQR